MIKIKQIEVKEIKRIFQRLPRILGRQAFLTFLALLLLSLALGGLCFYKYGFLAARVELQIPKKPLQLNEEMYNRILGEWEGREQRLKEIDVKQYPDPFRETYFQSSEKLTE